MADDHRPTVGGVSIVPVTEEVEILRKTAHGIAHEMNNVLATVMGLASVLETEFDEGSAAAEDVRAILRASRLGHELTRSLLSLAESGTPRLAEVSLNELVEAVTSFLHPSLGEEVHIETQLTSDLPAVVGDRGQLKHVVMSLAMNALHAIGSSGTLTFSTSAVTLSAEQLEGERCEPGEFVRFRVGDTGIGMDGATIERAFDPFFSTKSTGSQSGMGLPLVYRTIRAHGGRVAIYSKQGLGTAVTVDLPTNRTGRPSTLPPPSVEVATRDETVLVVDDDALVLRSSRRLLEKLGYGVLCAASGKEAMESYIHNADKISFVLLDLVMPEVDGMEVLRRLLRTDPDVKTIICSGYGTAESLQELIDAGAIAVIGKPFTLAQLRAVVDGID